MGKANFTEKFKRQAVRIFVTSERCVATVATGLGRGKSSLERWLRLFAGRHTNVQQQLARLRHKTSFCGKSEIY